MEQSFKWKGIYCLKSVRIRSFSGPYFPAFGLNTDQKNCKYGHFSHSDLSDFALFCKIKFLQNKLLLPTEKLICFKLTFLFYTPQKLHIFRGYKKVKLA